MTLEYEYFPVYTFVLICFVAYNLYRGFKKGLFFKILDLLVLLATLLIAWPAGRALGMAYPIFFGQEPGNWVLQFFNTVPWFLLVETLLRVLTAFLYKTIKWLHNIKIIGIWDQLLGLAVSAVTTFIWLSLLVMLLELPFFQNGAEYVEDSPLRIVKTVMDESLPFILEDFHA